MCGIAGWMTRTGNGFSAAAARDVFKAIEHRGPDDWGWLTASNAGVRSGKGFNGGFDGWAGLLHRRLSILDLSDAARQPMSSRDGRLHIAFNGEIYNYVELRDELTRAGCTFRTRSDTEVLLEGFGYWGPDLFPRLVGMFAFVLLDSENKSVLLVRDPFGIKPLYWTPWKGGVAFASEIKALLALGETRRTVDAQSLCDFLRFGTTDHRGTTLFANVHHVRAGHVMIWHLDRPDGLPEDVGSFWKLAVDHELDISFEEAASRLRDLFVESVRLHLRSDVPIGAALSGGVDSSAVVMAARSLEPTLDLQTFTYQAEEESLDESHWAAIIARAAGTRHHITRPGPSDVVEELSDLTGAQDEPFPTLSILAQYSVFKLAAQHGIKVMLSGQGADELLGGYPVFTAARIASLVRHGRWSDAASVLRRASSLPGRERLLYMLGPFLLPNALQRPLRHLIGEELWPSWLRRKWFEERGAHPMDRHSLRRGNDVLRWELLVALTESGLPKLLRYEDRNSMAHGIESRVPFLTPALASFLLSLPESYLIAADGTTKAVFREAMRGLVPNAILDRRDKIGFNAPGVPWMVALRPWMECRLRSQAVRSMPFLDVDALQQTWAAIADGKRTFDARVWRWITLAEWAERTGAQFAA